MSNNSYKQFWKISKHTVSYIILTVQPFPFVRDERIPIVQQSGCMITFGSRCKSHIEIIKYTRLKQTTTHAFAVTRNSPGNTSAATTRPNTATRHIAPEIAILKNDFSWLSLSKRSLPNGALLALNWSHRRLGWNWSQTMASPTVFAHQERYSIPAAAAQSKAGWIKNPQFHCDRLIDSFRWMMPRRSRISIITDFWRWITSCGYISGCNAKYLKF